MSDDLQSKIEQMEAELRRLKASAPPNLPTKPKIGSALSVRTDLEGRRFIDITMNGQIHSHVNNGQPIKCQMCESNPKLKSMVDLIVIRARDGF